MQASSSPPAAETLFHDDYAEGGDFGTQGPSGGGFPDVVATTTKKDVWETHMDAAARDVVATTTQKDVETRMEVELTLEEAWRLSQALTEEVSNREIFRLLLPRDRKAFAEKHFFKGKWAPRRPLCPPRDAALRIFLKWRVVSLGSRTPFPVLYRGKVTKLHALETMALMLQVRDPEFARKLTKTARKVRRWIQREAEYEALRKRELELMRSVHALEAGLLSALDDKLTLFTSTAGSADLQEREAMSPRREMRIDKLTTHWHKEFDAREILTVVPFDRFDHLNSADRSRPFPRSSPLVQQLVAPGAEPVWQAKNGENPLACAADLCRLLRLQALYPCEPGAEIPTDPTLLDALRTLAGRHAPAQDGGAPRTAQVDTGAGTYGSPRTGIHDWLVNLGTREFEEIKELRTKLRCKTKGDTSSAKALWCLIERQIEVYRGVVAALLPVQHERNKKVRAEYHASEKRRVEVLVHLAPTVARDVDDAGEDRQPPSASTSPSARSRRHGHRRGHKQAV